MSVTVQVTIGGIDLSAFQDETKLKITASQGGALENFDTASLEFHETGNFYLTPVSDTVNRADNASSIGATERPQIPYTKQGTTTTWAVVSKKITVTAHDGTAVFGEVITAQTTAAGYAGYPSGIYDQCSISCDVYLKSGDSSAAGLAFRVSGANNYLYAYMDSTNTITLGQRVSGTNTVLNTVTNSAFVSGGNIRVDLNLTNIAVYYTPPGSNAIYSGPTGTSSAGSTNTKHGYWVSTSASTTSGHSFKNFLVTPLYGTVYNQYNPMEWKEIIIRDTSVPEIIFAGVVDYTKPFISGGLDFCRSVTAKDYTYLLANTIIYKSYTNATDDAIIKDILNSYFPGSYFDVTNVQSTMIIPNFAAYYMTALEAVRQICAITGCQFYINYSKQAYYGLNQTTAGPCSFDEATGAFSNSSVRAFHITDYQKDMRALASRVYVVGGTDNVTNYTDTISTASGWLTSAQLTYGNITDISSFNVQGNTQQLLWVFKDKTNPNNTPVCSLVTDGSGVHNLAGLAGIPRNTTYSAQSILPGQKLVIWENNGGTGANAFTAQSYYFEKNKSYTITYDTGNVTIEYTGTNATGYASYQIISTNVSFFDIGRAIWIGPGWPIVVDRETGLIQYCNENANYWQPNSIQSHVVTYSASRQYIVVAARGDTVATYGSLIGGGNPGGGNRYFDTVVRNSQLIDTNSISALARATLLKVGAGIKSISFQTWYGQGLKVGQVISINAPSWQINGSFLIRKIDLSFMGASQVSYKIEAGDYDPEEADLTAILLRQQQNFNTTPNATVDTTTALNYANMVLHYYDDGTVYNQVNAFWG